MRYMVCIFLLSLIHAVTMAQIAQQFFHTETFGIEEGLGHSAIMEFQLDPNGLIWIYTSAGLQLFDGKNFLSFNHLITGNESYAHFDDTPEDELYFIYDDQVFKLDVVNYSSDSVPMISLPASPESKRNNLFLYENQASLFVWHRNDSVYQIDKNTFTVTASYLLPVKPNASDVLYKAGSFFPTESNILYIGLDYGLYAFDTHTGKHERKLLLSLFGSAILASRDTLVTLDAQYLNIYANGNTLHVPLPAPMQDFRGEYLLLKKPGVMLVALEGNIYEFDLQGLLWTARYQKAGGGELIDIKIREMRLDKTGNLYYSSFNAGLVHLHPRNPGFEYIGAKEAGGNFARRLSISDEHHLVLMGTLQDGLYIYDTSGLLIKHYLDFPGGAQESYISHILKINESRFLILANSAYVLDVTPNGALEIRTVKGFDLHWINYYDTEIETDDPDVIYVNTFYGLLTCHINDNITFTYERGHPLNGSSAITRFRDGYISAANNKLTAIDITLKQVTGTYPLPELGYARCILPYRPDQILLGANAGLYLIQVDSNARVLQKLYDKMVYALLPGNAPDEYWFSTDYGLFSLKPDMQVIHYSKETGLQDNEFNTNSCVKSASGKLYFGGINGITAFYPSKVRETEDSIYQFVSQIAINNKDIARYIPSKSERTFTTQHWENNISIDLLGRGIKSPRNYNYQYKMEGLAGSWIDMGTESQVNFHLMPGKYTFAYHIGDRFDPHPDVRDSLHFVIRPPFYRTWLFTSGVVLLISSLGLYLFYMQRKRQALKHQYKHALNQNLQKERMRISRELHDNIGAQMATVKRSINFIVSNSASLSSQQILQKMQDLEGVSTQINQELRDTIWATQHEHITVHDFITRVKSFVFQILGPDSPIRVHYTEHTDSQAIFGPFVTLNLHRICQEALHNIVKHSAATDIFISFESHDHQFVVTITDNGKGFDPENVSAGYGLQNMQHRATLVGADLKFDSKLSQGTTLTITVNRLTLAEDNL